MLHRDICFISPHAGRPDMDPVLLLLEFFTILCFLALYYRPIATCCNPRKQALWSRRNGQ
jgi:hypothetical protein